MSISFTSVITKLFDMVWFYQILMPPHPAQFFYSNKYNTLYSR
jgi:hypothetical protein